ncbi:hypothetical protein [Weissella hellenica]|uniref:Uncharacterized protein n=1 Tax=Weissella hellenica TaxID=46256 RepID=A0A4Y4G5W4_WEIHE|nr:hypothetical protein [Weissella hellenica]NKY66585.1 hypothetical protein [Weissella hellenica]GED35231.1 hypothetical protein WHE01_01350 [Weissella hellenica]SCB81581.1 hypothetical protein GA0061075_10333 [Weissella hellenica]
MSQKEHNKSRLNRYKPSTIRADAQRDYEHYKATSEWPKKDPAVVKRTLRLVLITVVIFLMLAIVLLLQVIGC